MTPYVIHDTHIDLDAIVAIKPDLKYDGGPLYGTVSLTSRDLAIYLGDAGASAACPFGARKGDTTMGRAAKEWNALIDAWKARGEAKVKDRDSEWWI